MRSRLGPPGPHLEALLSTATEKPTPFVPCVAVMQITEATRLSRLRRVACSPVTLGINLDPDHKAVVRRRLAVRDACTSFESSTDRSNRKLLIGLPISPGQNSGTVTADVDGGGNFEGGII